MILDVLSDVKSEHTNLESQNQVKSIPVLLRRSSIKLWGKSVQGFLSFDRTNKQTAK